MKYITLILLLTVLYQSNSQVLGIDFGTEFWKAALISPGKNLVIVQNSRSQRKTLNSIAFQEGVRYFEDDSKSKRLKKPQLSYFYLNRLIKALDNKQPLAGYKFQGNTYVFDDQDKSMTLQQVVGMILRNIKQLASLQAGTDIRDVVLSVPSNWGYHAKMCLVNAAHLADFSVLGLINQNSAAAIQFAISRNDTDPINVILFNYGSHNLQISVIKLFGFFDEAKNKTIQSIEALSHSTYQNVGGLRVDEQIAHYLAKQFTKKHKLDPLTNKKSYTKLVIKAGQAKQTLSANKDTQVYVQGLIDGIDLNLPLSRQIIQDCEHFKQFHNYLQQTIKKAGLTKSQIHSVQIIGGASRIPKVSSIIKQYFADTQNVEVGSHINGDQSVAFGSALRAANLSLTFRVKQLHFNDPMNINTKVVISTPDQGVILEQQLFSLSDHHGSKRTVSLNQNRQDLKITVYVGQEIVQQFGTKNVGDWRKKHEKQNVTGQPNVVIQFMMSSVHIAEVKDIYLNITINQTTIKQKIDYVEQQVEEEYLAKPKKKKQKKQQTQQTKNNQQEQKPTQQDKADAQQAEQAKQEQQNSQQKQQEVQQEKQQQQKPRLKTRKVNKTRTVKSQVEQHNIKPKRFIISLEQTFSKFKKYTKDQIEQKRKLLHQYQAYEKNLKDKAKIRNDFQSALYSLKNNFEQQHLKTFSKQKQLDRLIETVTQQLQWLDQNAWSATKQQFQEHFGILRDSYGPIYNRTVQYQGRQKSYNDSMGYLGMVYQKTNELLTTHLWIKQKVEAHLKKVNETAEWINAKIKQQVDRALNQNPILYNHEMIQKAEELRNQYYLLKMTPRPKLDDFMKNFEELKKKMEEQEKNKKQTEDQKQDETKQKQDEDQQEQAKQDNGNQEQEPNDQDL